MRRFAATGLVLILAAWAPPDRLPAPEPSQQTIPRSWIPEKKPEQAPPITLDVPPKQSSDYTHATGMDCSPARGQAASARSFVEAYQGAKAALEAGQFREAIAQLERATAYARSGKEWIAIEMMRIHVFPKLGNDAELIASLEALLSTKGCLTDDKLQEYRRMLERARERLRR